MKHQVFSNSAKQTVTRCRFISWEGEEDTHTHTHTQNTMRRYLAVCAGKSHILRASVWTQYSILRVYSRDPRRFIIHIFSSVLYSSHYEVKCSYWLNSTWLLVLLIQCLSLLLGAICCGRCGWIDSLHEWSPDLHWEGQPVAGLWAERGEGPRGPGSRWVWMSTSCTFTTGSLCVFRFGWQTRPGWNTLNSTGLTDRSTLSSEYISLEW